MGPDHGGGPRPARRRFRSGVRGCRRHVTRRQSLRGDTATAPVAAGRPRCAGVATILSSTVGYSLRAYANRFVDSATLVLYNAVQPPLTALLAVCVGLGGFGWREAGATALVGAAVFIVARDDDAEAVRTSSPRRAWRCLLYG